MLSKQLKPQWLPAHSGTPCPWPLWTKLYSKTPRNGFHQGLLVATPGYSLASFSLTSCFLNRKMNLFQKGGAELTLLAPARCHAEPGSTESLKSIEWQVADTVGFLLQSRSAKHLGGQAIWQLPGVAGLQLLYVPLTPVGKCPSEESNLCLKVEWRQMYS